MIKQTTAKRMSAASVASHTKGAVQGVKFLATIVRSVRFIGFSTNNALLKHGTSSLGRMHPRIPSPLLVEMAAHSVFEAAMSYGPSRLG